MLVAMGTHQRQCVRQKVLKSTIQRHNLMAAQYHYDEIRLIFGLGLLRVANRQGNHN